MKVIAYKNLCKKNKRSRVHIYCTRKIFKPLAFTMGAFILMFVYFFNLNVNIP